MAEQATVQTPEARVLPRKYIVEKNPELADNTGQVRVGTVKRVDGKTIFVEFDGLEGEREMRASHLMLDRGNGVKSTSAGNGDGQSEVAGGGSAARALDPNAPEIQDQDVEALRAQQASRRQRLIGHFANPEDPAFGGGEGHNHNDVQLSEDSAKRRSGEDLDAYHRNAHQDVSPEGPDHP
jgi:hypothetical protein